MVWLSSSVWGTVRQLNPVEQIIATPKTCYTYHNSCCSFFISSKILPIQMLFFESVSNFMYDISNKLAPDIFIKSKSVHSYNTRASSSDKFHIKHQRLTQQRNSFTRFGAKAWNCFPSQMCKLHKPVFKKKIREALHVVLGTQDEYIEAPALLLKMNRYLK